MVSGALGRGKNAGEADLAGAGGLTPAEDGGAEILGPLGPVLDHLEESVAGSSEPAAVIDAVVGADSVCTMHARLKRSVAATVVAATGLHANGVIAFGLDEAYMPNDGRLLANEAAAPGELVQRPLLLHEAGRSHRVLAGGGLRCGGVEAAKRPGRQASRLAPRRSVARRRSDDEPEGPEERSRRPTPPAAALVRPPFPGNALFAHPNGAHVPEEALAARRMHDGPNLLHKFRGDWYDASGTHAKLLTKWKQDGREALQRALDAGQGELELHETLKQHPMSLALRFIPTQYHHVPDRAALFSRPQLGGEYEPDFAFVLSDSDGARWHFIELESATKPPFTATGEQAKGLRSAVKQVTDWGAWFRKHRSFAEKKFIEWQEAAEIR